ncbi:vWA domain-containing protein [Leptospira wolffii]|uniref:vWA domain-containing protein n=1 Tax=Leptospira wolffii TaxID=409998 RepID=UPI0002E69529|nr:vWA domain-containing protein [Leptospira wolffii]EPG65169.1 von Willebrand factor type A domain protein [Leptospira wolffii serovar Khorat str. Khorat-H2]
MLFFLQIGKIGIVRVLSGRFSILLLLLFAFPLLSAPELYPPENRESSKLFVLDASGSMNEYLGIYQKIHLAKKYVRHYVDKLEDETEVGFIAYGNRLPGCQSSRLYQPLEKGNRPQFRNKLFGLTPSGATPLAESIRIAGDYIIRRKSPTELILVTDGIESCYGDPEKELRILQQKGVDFKMHVLGLGLKPEEKRIMESLAKTGKGTYYNVEGDGDFYNAMEDLLKKETPPKIAHPEIETPALDRKIRITNMEKSSEGSETDSYRVDFEFENPGSTEQCVILNLKRSGNSKPQEWNPLRASRPELTLRTDQSCFSSSNGKGSFLIEVPKNLPLQLELELWDMSKIPQSVGNSGERRIRN